MSLSAVVYDVQRYLIPVLIGSMALAFPILAAFYYKYRRHPILRARRPEWSLLNQFIIVIGVASYGYDGWRAYPSCAKILFSNAVLAMLALDSHIIRCWLLLYNWNVSWALRAASSNDDDDESPSAWWLRHTHLASNRIMAPVMASLTAFHIGCWLLFDALHGWDRAWQEDAANAICTSPVIWFFGVWGALSCLMGIALYQSYCLRQVTDAFAIRSELMTSGGIWVVGTMPFWFVALLFPSLERVPNFIIMLPLTVILCGARALYLSLVVPLRMVLNETHQYQQFELSSVVMTEPTLTPADGSGPVTIPWPSSPRRQHQHKTELRKQLDLNTGIVGPFIEFLTKEFSVENWKFYSDVLQLRVAYGAWKTSHAGRSGLTCGQLDWFRVTGPERALLETSINRIYAMYLCRSAPFEINLDSDRMHQLQACFDQDHLLRAHRVDDIPELLCQAQDEIYELMRTDSYERFKKTADFNKALSQI